MASVLNPEIPYVGEIPGGLSPGKMLTVRGNTPPDAIRFAINYQLGPNMNPRDDIALHLSPRFPEGFVTRNHVSSMAWGPDENAGPLWIQPGQDFEVIVLCEPLQYKIAINGRHFTEFGHRLPYQKVTHLVIDGDVGIKSISFESIGAPPMSPRAPLPPDVPIADFGPPGPGGLYPTLKPHGPFPQGSGGYGPPPNAYGGAPDPSRAYGYQPGYEQTEEEKGFGGLDKVGLAVGGLIAAGGVAAAVHAYNKSKQGHDDSEHEKKDVSKAESEGGLNLGALGTALASTLVSNALQGNAGNAEYQQGYPSQNAGGAGGMLGSLLGALGGSGNAGGGGGNNLPYGGIINIHGADPPPPPPSNDSLGSLGSILGNVLGGGGGGHQQSGGYQPSGGYGSHQQSGGDLLSGIGSAIGSTLLSSAMDSLTKNRSHGNDRPSSPQPPLAQYDNYGPPRHNPPSPLPSSARAFTPPPSGGGKLTADDISKGLGLDD